MGWVVRFSAKNEVLETELIVSQLWDRGTIGVFETEDGAVVAGFDTEAGANHSASWLRTIEDVIAESIVVEPAATEAEWAANTEAITHRVATDRHRFSMAVTARGTFGHGGHPTTELALDLLLASVDDGMRVLDLGTGSGLLAIAAAKAGAGSVTAIDIDPNAVAVAIDNAAANGVSIECSTTAASRLRASNQGGFDLVVMNVLLPVHRELAADVAELLAAGGRLITSGYLREQASGIASLYVDERGLRRIDSATAGDWASDVFARNASV